MENRISPYPVLDIIKDRWSPRAMSGEPISEQELYTLFEAARWAPSSYNNHPWIFIYADRESSQWEKFFDLLYEPNKVWAHRAAVLILILSRKFFYHNDKFSRTHSFDTGAAVENLALQGASMGLVVHGMEGFDYDCAKHVLKVPKEYNVEALFAVGKPAHKDVLPDELQQRERPSGRKMMTEFVYKGSFGSKID